MDGDPQETTLMWSKARLENPQVESILTMGVSGKIYETIQDLNKRYQDVIIDCGGHDNETMRSCLVSATHLLIPFRPKRRDLGTIGGMQELVATAKIYNPILEVRAVITQCPTAPNQVGRILESKDLCKAFEITPLNAVTFNRNIYDDAEENGYSVFETGSDLKARAEITEIAQEFLGI